MRQLDRREILKASASIAPLAGMLDFGETPADSRPNTIFIMADDLGHADLNCCGQTRIRTPRIDQMAAGGTRFTASYLTPL